MPSILYHLSFAEKVYRKLGAVTRLDEVNFMSGNLIPDYATDKIQSHYRKQTPVDVFSLPRMELVKKELCIIDNPIKLGMYGHLYLDYYFIKEFLMSEFLWDAEGATNPRNNKKWNIQTFFSASGLYGAYTEINQLMLRDGHVSLSTLNEIPEILPDTGMAVFDKRLDRTWKAELEEYMMQKKEYTGEILDYGRLCRCIERIATRFVQEISGMS